MNTREETALFSMRGKYVTLAVLVSVLLVLSGGSPSPAGAQNRVSGDDNDADGQENICVNVVNIIINNARNADDTISSDVNANARNGEGEDSTTGNGGTGRRVEVSNEKVADIARELNLSTTIVQNCIQQNAGDDAIVIVGDGDDDEGNGGNTDDETTNGRTTGSERTNGKKIKCETTNGETTDGETTDGGTTNGVTTADETTADETTGGRTTNDEKTVCVTDPDDDDPRDKPKGVVDAVSADNLPNTGGADLVARGIALSMVLSGVALSVLLLVKSRRQRT